MSRSSFDPTALAARILKSVERFERDLKNDPGFAYNIADAQNRLLHGIAEELLQSSREREVTDVCESKAPPVSG